MDREFIPPTQMPPTQLLEDDPLAVSMTREYDKIILYCWYPPKGMRPFKEYHKSRFMENEIREEWYKYQIKPESRGRKLKSLKSFTPNSMSLYAKVEKGKLIHRPTIIYKNDLLYIILLNFILIQYF